MIVLRSTYTASGEEVGALRQAHLDWLAPLVEAGTVIAAGRLDPPTGAVIVLPGTDGASALRLFDEDPYVLGGVAQYETLVRFVPGMVHAAVRALDPA